ncbi:MAG: GNAT family N-acetyltransferase [Saprospiraceae bacterium]
MSNQASYRQFCKTLPDLPVFLQPWYLDAAQQTEIWDAALLWHEDEVVAALPYFFKKKWIFRSIVLPPFVKYLGPVLHPDHRTLSNQHQLYAGLIRQLPAFDSFKLDMHPEFTNWLPFRWAGFRQTTRYTYRLNIADLEQTLDGIRYNNRREIRKADQFFSLRHDLSLSEFYRINKMSFDRQQIKIPYSITQLERHDQALNDHQARELFALDAQEQIYAVAYLIWDRQRAYFHLAGDDPRFRNKHAGIWLIWKCIEYARNTLQLTEFDFEGSMIPSIEAVRRRFGARQTPYFRLWKYNSRLYRFLDRWEP